MNRAVFISAVFGAGLTVAAGFMFHAGAGLAIAGAWMLYGAWVFGTRKPERNRH